MPATLRQCLRPVAHHLAACQQARHEGMLFEPLEGQMRIEHRVLVIEPRYEPDGQHAVGHGVDERSAEFFHPQREAHCVNHGSDRKAILRHLPQFLDAQGVNLRQSSEVQRLFSDKRLCQIAAHAVAENGDLRADIDTRLERGLPLTPFIDTAVAGADAHDAVAVVQDL